MRLKKEKVQPTYEAVNSHGYTTGQYLLVGNCEYGDASLVYAQNTNNTPFVDPSITVYGTNNRDKVEELFEKISSYSFITASPITGEPVDVVRTSDIYHILCTYFNVDPDSTSFRQYK